jgi:hypothetical protein
MHDLLFEDQEHLALPDLLPRARLLNLDVDRFTEDLRARVYEGKVQADFLSGVYSGVQGPPTFSVNGVRYQGAPYYQSLFRVARCGGPGDHGVRTTCRRRPPWLGRRQRRTASHQTRTVMEEERL